jgi:hypothetical protein
MINGFGPVTAAITSRNPAQMNPQGRRVRLGTPNLRRIELLSSRGWTLADSPPRKNCSDWVSSPEERAGCAP